MTTPRSTRVATPGDVLVSVDVAEEWNAEILAAVSAGQAVSADWTAVSASQDFVDAYLRGVARACAEGGGELRLIGLSDGLRRKVADAAARERRAETDVLVISASGNR